MNVTDCEGGGFISEKTLRLPLLPCDIQVIMMKKIVMMESNLTPFFSDHKDSCDLRERAMP